MSWVMIDDELSFFGMLHGLFGVMLPGMLGCTNA